jgi:hypothetical protein
LISLKLASDLGAPSAQARINCLARNGAYFRLLIFVVINCFLVNLVIWCTSKIILHHHWLNRLSLDTGFHDAYYFMRRIQGTDSWGPMLAASDFFRSHVSAPLYASVFFQSHVKFQYPLSALVPFVFLSRHGVTDPAILHWSRRITWVALWLIVAVAMATATKLIPKNTSTPARAGALAAVAIASFWFHPILRSFVLGQVQILLTLGFVIAFYLWMTGSEKSAGAILGILSLVKPQYALMLLWMALRRRWGALIAGLVCVLAGVAVSVAVFGWHNNLGYLAVLKMISRHGESYELNQSMNGLLNRLLFNGANLLWLPGPSSFPQFRPLIYAGTLVSTVLLLALGFFYPWGQSRRGGLADFSMMAIVSTIASPVAWEHHYGIALPILIWLYFTEYAQTKPPLHIGGVALAYLLIGDCFSGANLLWNTPVLNILQSYTYFGGLLLLLLLTRTGCVEPQTRQTEAVVS